MEYLSFQSPPDPVPMFSPRLNIAYVTLSHILTKHCNTENVFHHFMMWTLKAGEVIQLAEGSRSWQREEALSIPSPEVHVPLGNSSNDCSGTRGGAYRIRSSDVL